MSVADIGVRCNEFDGVGRIKDAKPAQVHDQQGGSSAARCDSPKLVPRMVALEMGVEREKEGVGVTDEMRA